jgi:hypothetical protein
MNRRIGVWMLAGLVVASCWAAVAALIPHTYNPGYFWTTVAVTAPASLLGRRMPLGMVWFILLNGGIYALVGAVIELIRGPLSRHHWKQTSA